MTHAYLPPALLLLLLLGACSPEPTWSTYEKQVIESLVLAELPPVPIDASNRWAQDRHAFELGQMLFHDKRLSATAQIACATCHRPDYFFTDDQPRSRGIGLTRRHTPGLLGVAYSRWLYWDGRRDSLWAQALTPIEHADEQGLSRAALARLLAADADYKRAYERVFGVAPEAQPVDQVFVNVGKAIAAFETTLLPGEGLFDHYVAGTAALSITEELGLRLFIGKGACVSCHNGPLLTNQGFHNIGTGNPVAGDDVDPKADLGRWQGVRDAAADPFNCLGAYSDALPQTCGLSYAKFDGLELKGAFKVPSLRNVAVTPPYMHDGRFATLQQVIAHYVSAPPAPGGHSEITPLDLSAAEQLALVAFLGTLTEVAH